MFSSYSYIFETGYFTVTLKNVRVLYKKPRGKIYEIEKSTKFKDFLLRYSAGINLNIRKEFRGG